MEKDDEAYLLLEMDNGGMKRVLTEEIPSLTRPAKGQLLFKNSKNNPVHICDAWPCSHHTKFELLLGKVQECKGSDIRIMNASQSYSHPFKEQIESEGQIPALVRPLGYLHDGYWSEEKSSQRCLMRVLMSARIANLLCLLVALIWGGGFIATDLALESFSPFSMLVCRFYWSCAFSMDPNSHEENGHNKS